MDRNVTPTIDRPQHRTRRPRLRSEGDRMYELANLPAGVYDLHSWPFEPDRPEFHR